jgi:hypothetical protein
VTNGLKMGPPFKLTEHPRKFGGKADGSRGKYSADCARFQRQSQYDCPAAVRPLMRAALMMLVCDFPFPGSLKAAQ